MREQFLSIDQERSAEVAKPVFVVTRVTEGLEFGEGNISGSDADPDTLRAIDEAIHTSPEIIVPVDRDKDGNLLSDDGCGDGRGVGLVKRGYDRLKKSLNRPKVFGGSPAMATGARIGLGLAKGQNLETVFFEAIDQLEAAGKDFGAHTAENVANPSCDSGCGAIDGAPKVIKAIPKYRMPITGTLKMLGLEGADVDEVLDNYEAYSLELPEQPAYSGKVVMDHIISMGKVVKQLVGGHKERRIVLNTIRDYTINQGLIREVTNDEAQIFAVDTWRLDDIASKLYGSDSAQERRAVISELVYTLGVAAVLTPGDMPIDIIQEAA